MSQTIDPAILALEDIRNGSLAKTAQAGVPVAERASETPVNTTPVQPGGLFSGKSDGMADIKQTDADRSSAWDNIKGNKDLPMLGLMFGLNLLANSGKMDLGSALGQSGVATINAYNTHMKQRADRKYKLDSLAETKRMNNYTAKKMEDEATERLRIKGLNDRIAKGDRSAMWELDPMGMAKLEQQERMQRQAQGAAAANIRLQHELSLRALDEKERRERLLREQAAADIERLLPQRESPKTNVPDIDPGDPSSEEPKVMQTAKPSGGSHLNGLDLSMLTDSEKQLVMMDPIALAAHDKRYGTKISEIREHALKRVQDGNKKTTIGRPTYVAEKGGFANPDGTFTPVEFPAGAGGNKVLPFDKASKLAGVTESYRDLGNAVSGLFDANGNFNRVMSGMGSIPGTQAKQYQLGGRRAIESWLRAMTGAAAPKHEVDEYMEQFFPKPWDDENVAIDKLDALERRLRSTAKLSGFDLDENMPSFMSNIRSRRGRKGETPDDIWGKK